MDELEPYTLEDEGGRIILKTTSFRADKGSVLHSGIFNRELASSFLAAIAAVSVLMVIAVRHEPVVGHYILSAVIFILLFPIFRVYLFRRAELETVIDRASETVEISLKETLRRKKLRLPLGSLIDIVIKLKKIEPQNPDGVAFVEKVALQHGTVIPGFGKTEEFFNIELQFENEKHTVMTSKSESEAESVVSKLKSFINS